jgi:hypothetical protein
MQMTRATHPLRPTAVRSAAVLAVLALALGACSDDILVDDTAGGGTGSGLRVINASQAPLTVLVDGRVVAQGLTVASVSSMFDIAPGTHQVRLQTATGASATLSVDAVAGRTVTTFGTPAANAGLAAAVLEDTGSVVPAGKSKLRVTHLAANAPPVDIWRTQPDFQTPIRVMFPFAYRATSSYIQSDPGAWEVFVTPEGGTTRLATTGPITVPGGERRTVVLLDSAGVLRLRVIQE